MKKKYDFDPTQTTPYATAKQLTALKHQFHQEWTTYFHALAPLHRERFWTLIVNLQHEIQTYRFRYNRTDGIDAATNEFFRKALTGESQTHAPHHYTLTEALHFARTWNLVSHDLDNRYRQLIQGYGDDSYSDLMDALPLAGKQICETDYQDFQDFQSTIAGLGKALATLILHGENYIQMALQQAAKKWYLYAVIDAATAQDARNNTTNQYAAED